MDQGVRIRATGVRHDALICLRKPNHRRRSVEELVGKCAAYGDLPTCVTGKREHESVDRADAKCFRPAGRRERRWFEHVRRLDRRQVRAATSDHGEEHHRCLHRNWLHTRLAERHEVPYRAGFRLVLNT